MELNKANSLHLYRGHFKNMGTSGPLIHLSKGQTGYPEKYKTVESREKRDYPVRGSGSCSGMGLKHKVDL
jgi:hypothetical protein